MDKHGGNPLPEHVLESIAREHGRHQGPDHDAGRRRLPLGERGAAQGARPLRPGAAVQELPGRALALRGRRPRDRPREHRGPLRRDRVRGGHRRGARAARLDRGEDRHEAPPGLGHLDQADLDHRDAADRRVRLRLRAPQRPLEGHGRPQGEHHEVLGRALPARRARGRRGELGHRVRGPHRGQPLHAARAAARGVRRARAPQPLRRRRLGSRRGPDRRARPRARRELRHEGGGVRAHARLGAEVHGPEQGEPDGDDALRRDDAPPSRRTRRRRRARRRDRRGDRRRQVGDLRHEADPRRPHLGGNVPGRRRNHRNGWE